MEHCLTVSLGTPKRIIAYNTYQVKDYNRFELAAFSEPAKQQWRDENWNDDLQKAYAAGREMAAGTTADN